MKTLRKMKFELVDNIKLSDKLIPSKLLFQDFVVPQKYVRSSFT